MIKEEFIMKKLFVLFVLGMACALTGCSNNNHNEIDVIDEMDIETLVEEFIDVEYGESYRGEIEYTYDEATYIENDTEYVDYTVYDDNGEPAYLSTSSVKYMEHCVER